MDTVKTQVPVEDGVYVLGYLNATTIKAASPLTINIPLKRRQILTLKIVLAGARKTFFATNVSKKSV